MLFEIIRKSIPKHQILVDVISELLEVSADAAYRRIRAEKLLNFNEIALLCQHFNISLDTLINVTGDNDIRCHYAPLDLRDPQNYLIYLEKMDEGMDPIMNEPDGELMMTAVDLPVYHYLSYKELTSFRLFAWCNSVYGFTEGYDEFVKHFDYDGISNSCKKVVKSFQNCPSIEIWTDYALDQTLRSLNYHFEMGHFADVNIPIVLCEQLLDMLNTIHNWTVKGLKGPNETPFKFYVSETDLNNNFVLLKKDGVISCSLKLFIINHFRIYDQRFCTEAENWLNTAIQRSTLISGSSEKQRYNFFNQQRQKINTLMEKVGR